MAIRTICLSQQVVGKDGLNLLFISLPHLNYGEILKFFLMYFKKKFHSEIGKMSNMQ